MLCGTSLRSSGAKAKVNRGGSGNVVRIWACMLHNRLLTLNTRLGGGVVRRAPATTSAADSTVTDVVPPRSAPGTRALILTLSMFVDLSRW